MELVNESPPTGVLSKSIGNTAVYTNSTTTNSLHSTYSSSSQSTISSRSSSSSTSSLLGSSSLVSQQTKISQQKSSKNCSSTNDQNVDLTASTLGLTVDQRATTLNTNQHSGLGLNSFTNSSNLHQQNRQQNSSPLNCVNSNSVLTSNLHNLKQQFNQSDFLTTNLNCINSVNSINSTSSKNQCDDNFLNCDKSDLNFNNINNLNLNNLNNLNNDFNKFDKLSDLNINTLNSLNCINSINSLQKKSSSLSSSQNNSSLINNCAVNLSDNFNSNFTTQSTNSLNQPLFNSPSNLNQLNQFNQLNQLNHLNNQQKVKRTRQRVDAGEPRNSYASISNYASNRLAGKASSKFQQQISNHLQKGLLLDQLDYLGLNNNLNNLSQLNALLSNGQYSLDDLLLNSNQNTNSISTLLASLADKQSFDKQSNLNSVDATCPSPKDKLNNQMILNQSFNWNNSANQFNNQSNLKFSNQTALSAGANLEQSSFLEQSSTNMAKSRFSEDAVTLDYNVKGKIFTSSL